MLPFAPISGLPVSGQPVSSGSEITLVGANSTQANTSGTGAITQTHVLTGTNSAQDNTSGTGSISQVHILSGADGTQDNSSSTGAISLGSAIDLIGANSAQDNVSGTGAISQAHNLTGSDSSQSNTSGTGAIAQVHILAGADCTQINLSPDVSFTGPLFASLGGTPDKPRKPVKAKRKKPQEEIESPLPPETAGRIRDELLGASLTADVIERAKARAKRIQAEETAILLIL
jgi:hypothetical protein